MDNKKTVSASEWRAELSKRLPKVIKSDPKVKMLLGDIEVTLEFNNQAALDLLEDTQFNLIADKLTPDVMKDPKLLGCLIHRGIQKNHPDMSLNEVNDKLSLRQFTYYTFTLSDALAAFFPDMSDMEVEKTKKVEEDTQEEEDNSSS